MLFKLTYYFNKINNIKCKNFKKKRREEEGALVERLCGHRGGAIELHLQLGELLHEAGVGLGYVGALPFHVVIGLTECQTL